MHREKAKARREASEELKPTDTLIFYFQPPTLGEKQVLLCKPPVRGILYGSPSKLIQGGRQ